MDTDNRHREAEASTESEESPTKNTLEIPGREETMEDLVLTVQVDEDVEVNDAIKKAKAFLKVKYPLSKKGKELKREVEQALASESDNIPESLAARIPTIENPKLDIFADLDIPADNDEELFGWELINVQVTKGCTHRCSFCAVNAFEEKMQYMPFPAVYKIAERKRYYDKNFDRLWEQLSRLCERESDIMDDNLLLPRDKFPFHLIEDKMGVQGNPQYLILTKSMLLERSICNYYDNESFDYRDRSFVHEDGSPADYGDVVEELATKERPVSITTAGWSLNDKIAQRAAEKIVRMDRNRISKVRISVSPYEKTALSDPEEYLRQIKNVIQTLAPLSPKILYFDDSEDDSTKDFKANVIEPLKRFKEENGIKGVNFDAPVSFFSGPMADESKGGNDVGACESGVHIHPDGKVLKQSFILEEGKKVSKGSRPEPTGHQLW